MQRDGWRSRGGRAAGTIGAAIVLLAMTAGLMPLPAAGAQAAEPARERLLEQALIVQLHPLLYDCLHRIYQEEDPRYTGAHIIEIDGAVTGVRREGRAGRADADGEARVYRIVVELTRGEAAADDGTSSEDDGAGDKEQSDERTEAEEEAGHRSGNRTAGKKGVPRETVLLTLDNDTPDGRFTVRSYEIISRP